MTTTWPHGDPRAVAHDILRDSRYREALAPQAPKSLWETLLEDLVHWWQWLTRPLGHFLGNDLVTTIVGFAVLALAFVGIVLVVVRFARPMLQRGALPWRPHAEALEQTGDARLFFERALAAAAAGRHREAAALLWVSALHALDERGRVRYDPARTPAQWRRAVRDPNFDRFARDAVVALFGDRAVDATLVARMRSAYDAVLGS
jgi:hypothetical protein